MRLGASAGVVITTGSAEDVLTVPTAAVSTTGTRSSVTVVNGTTRTPVQVTKGLQGTSTTEVSGGGLKAGDEVLLVTSATTTSGSTGVPGGGGFGGPGLGGAPGGGR
ncbi:hypothetical protein GCM10025868_27030 [Angustibacter aerolatus]|uniref:Uncharacterized protein n=1 Tax=Angustibacter aerolatus TaxID=1162965 RepID=A0ABQ6JJ62_9ACTN|nr:hypothetical protein GCM10025868_27030 [Angustibacter aerolatus]